MSLPEFPNVKDSLAEDMIEAKCLYASMKKQERDALKDAYKLGTVLARIRLRCVPRTWLKKLEEIGVNRMHAWRCLRVAECNSVTLASCNSMHDAILRFKIPEGEEPEKELEGKKTKTADIVPLCDGCQRKGPRKDCKGCEEIEVAWRAGRRAKAGEREPGDDTESERQDRAEARAADRAKPETGRVMFEWKATDQYVGTLVRQVDLFGNAYDVKEHIEVDKLRKRLADWHADFRKVYERLAGQKAP